jgi:tetratricopeptide (TPR) repeat protein
MTQNNLAAAYGSRIRGERADNLERAIAHYQEALTVRAREAFPEQWAQTQNNLANAYGERIRGERADNLERAIAHACAACEVYTREAFPSAWAGTQHNLANAYQHRIRGDRADNLERAIEHYQEALTVYSRETFPAEYRRTQKTLGVLHFVRADWAHAHSAFAAAIEAGADLLAAAYTEVGRLSEVGESARLYADDAYTLLRLRRAGDGLMRLEQGNTRLLSEALALAALDLTMLTDDDRVAVRSARQAVHELEAEMRLPMDTPARHSDRDLAEALRNARADLRRRIASIRAERPDFMPAGLDLPGFLTLIPAGGALVAPLFTSKGSVVFVLPHGTTAVSKEHVIELKRFTTADLRTLLRGADNEQLGGWLGAYTNSDTDRLGWLAVIDATGQDLWEGLMGPVDARLRELGLQSGASVLLLPQAGLGLLPLHAAWREVEGKRRYFLDDWTVSYAPSGYALAVGRQRLEEPQRSLRSLLAVVNPTRDLMFSAAEAEAVMGLFSEAERESLPEAEATLKAVTRKAPGRAYLNFSCHGEYNWRDPMRSGLRLAGGEALTPGGRHRAWIGPEL